MFFFSFFNKVELQMRFRICQKSCYLAFPGRSQWLLSGVDSVSDHEQCFKSKLISINYCRKRTVEFSNGGFTEKQNNFCIYVKYCIRKSLFSVRFSFRNSSSSLLLALYPIMGFTFFNNFLSLMISPSILKSPFIKKSSPSSYLHIRQSY